MSSIIKSTILRSSFCPEDVLGGTKIFLTHDGEEGCYRVESRWQILYSSRKGLVLDTPKAQAALKRATAAFERILTGDL